jgi:hypothetical protein
MELFDFFQTMIDPEALPPQRVPDAHAAMSATFKTPYVVDLPYSGVWIPETGVSSTIDEKTPVNGYSEVILVPGTTSCYLHTLGVEAQIVQSGGTEIVPLVPILASHPVETDKVAGIGGQIVTACSQGLQVWNTDYTLSGVASGVASLPKLDSDGHFRYEVNIIPTDEETGAFTIAVGFNNRGISCPTNTQGQVRVHWSDGTTSEVAELVTSYGIGSETGPVGVVNMTTFTFANAGETGIGFSVAVRDTDSSSHWIYSLSVLDANVFLPARSATSFAVVDAPELGTLSETQAERTTALTGLLTYMGSTLQDGGQISAARLGMGLSPLRSPSGDVYSYLASLPFYNDDFALRDGIYSWWLPDSLQEHFYVPYRQPRSSLLEENSVLQFSVLRDNPEQAVRLKVVQNMEIITRSRLYTSETGPINPAYSSVIALIKTIPAVTINSQHVGILRRALNGVRSWISRPSNWKKLILKGSSVLNQLAPGSLPTRIVGGLASLIS